MKRDKQHLLDDLLNESGSTHLRNSVLSQAHGLLRRKRRRAALTQSLALLAMFGCALVVWRGIWRPSPPAAPGFAPVASAPPSHRLTDQELLNLFPDTPVGLATVDGKQRLIFLNPADEERFITRF